MTQRLPVSGSDSGTWGDILNGFLLQSHGSDGSLKPAAVSAAGGILASKQNTAPANPVTNDLWYDSANDLWKRWNGTVWVKAGVSQADLADYAPLASPNFTGTPKSNNSTLLTETAAAAKYVSPMSAQSFSDAEKQQARANISAVYLPPTPPALGAVAGYDSAVADTTTRWFATEELVARALGWSIITDSRWAGGAKPDNGATDSTAAIQAALNNGGVVWCPPGNYGVTHLDMPVSGTILRGVNGGGPGTSPAAAQVTRFRRPNGATGTFVTIPSGVGQGVIEDIDFDARSQPGTILHFADAADATNGEECQWKLNRLYLHDSTITSGAFADGDGIYMGKGRRAALGHSVLVRNTGRYSFNLQGSDSEWLYCTSAGAGWDGWQVNAGATRITGGQSYGNGATPGALTAVSVATVSTAGTSPTTITTSAAHGLRTGMRVLIRGAVGVSSQINMVHVVTVVDTTTFTVTATNTGTLTSGGTVQPYAAGVWQNSGTGTVLSGHGMDRNWFAGLECSLLCGPITLNACMLTSNGRQADGSYGNVEVNSQNASVSIVSCVFTALVSGQTNRPANDVLTRNSSSWRDVCNVSSGSTGTSTQAYTNFTTGLRLNSQGNVLIDSASAGYAALRLRAAASQTANLFEVLTSGNGTTGIKLDFAGRPAAAGATPTAAPSANAGTGATATVVGSDFSHTLSLTAGSGSLGSTSMATVTFSSAYAGAPRVILQSVENGLVSTWDRNIRVSASTTGYTIYNAASPAASQLYQWYVQVIG